MNGIPSPKERPDLYDDFDGLDRPEGWKNPVSLPPDIQKLVDERQAALRKRKQAAE